MVSVKSLIGAGAAALISSAAFAADLGAPPPVQFQPPVQVAEQSGWYLRGDVGVGAQSFSSFNLEPAPPTPITVDQKDIQGASIAGVGIGYDLNSWLRFDVTGEYRTAAAFKGIVGTQFTGGVNGCLPGSANTCFDTYTGNFSAAVFMANAYLDLGTWWCLTPYVGGGVGAAWDHISGVEDVTDQNLFFTGHGFTNNDSSSWNFAWNVQAGLTYNVSDALKIDFNYRFLNMGSPQSAGVVCQNTNSTCIENINLKDMTSNDFRIGVRYMLNPAPAPVMPLSTRG